MGWHDSAGEFDRHVRRLHERCQGAYHAFDSLPRLVDDLRILTVNAELASARAGDHGRAVRVLTHFATESVSRLLAVVPRMIELKKQTYGFAGTVLRAAADVLKVEAAGARVQAAGHVAAPGAEDPLIALGRARASRLTALSAAASGLTRTHQLLVDAVRSVREVTIQVEIITANIAIEATSAGPFERELQAVADTMRTPVEQLRAMVDDAHRLLREAAETNLALATLGVK